MHCLCSYSSSDTLVIILYVSSRAVKIISLVVLTASDSFQRTQFSVGCGANCLYNQAPTDKEIADAATKSSSHDEASSVVSNTVYVHYIIFIFSTHQISHSFMGHFCQCIFKIWPTVLFVLRLLYPWKPSALRLNYHKAARERFHASLDSNLLSCLFVFTLHHTYWYHFYALNIHTF